MRCWDDPVYLRLLAALLGAGFGLAALFAAWPGLDIRAAGLFHTVAGFPLADSAPVAALRLAYRIAVNASFLLMLWLLAAPRLTGHAPRVPPRIWSFGIALYLLGPGLLANVVLKDHWGRARPDAIAAFGGPMQFTGPFEIAGQCLRNCSFVSGEGAGAAALASLAIALAWPMLRRKRIGVAATVAFALGVMLVRMGPGRHFLSDMLFAFLLVGLVAMALYPLFGVGEARRGLRPGDIASDLRSGFRLG